MNTKCSSLQMIEPLKLTTLESGCVSLLILKSCRTPHTFTFIITVYSAFMKSYALLTKMSPPYSVTSDLCMYHYTSLDSRPSHARLDVLHHQEGLESRLLLLLVYSPYPKLHNSSCTSCAVISSLQSTTALYRL